MIDTHTLKCGYIKNISKSVKICKNTTNGESTHISFRKFAQNINLLGMKKFLLMSLMMLTFVCTSFAQKKAEIKFEKTCINIGTFSESNPVQKCVFKFTNVGDAPLIINQAVASCGCTVPKYTKAPVQPGEKGEISVTYNGKGKFPGHFKKSITIRTNGETEMTRLYIEGVMEEAQ